MIIWPYFPGHATFSQYASNRIIWWRPPVSTEILYKSSLKWLVGVKEALKRWGSKRQPQPPTTTTSVPHIWPHPTSLQPPTRLSGTGMLIPCVSPVIDPFVLIQELIKRHEAQSSDPPFVLKLAVKRSQRRRGSYQQENLVEREETMHAHQKTHS